VLETTRSSFVVAEMKVSRFIWVCFSLSGYIIFLLDIVSISDFTILNTDDVTTRPLADRETCSCL